MEPCAKEEGSDMLGQSWEVLFDGLDDGAQSLPVSTRLDPQQPSSDAKRLPVKDMPIFGRCPETDSFITVVCSFCGCAIMPHAFRRHIRLKHGEEETSSTNVLSTAALAVKTVKTTSPLKKLSKSASSSPPESTDEDLTLLGRTETDCVVCSICSIAVAPHAFRKHVLKVHADDTSVKPLLASSIKVKAIKKPSPKKSSSKSASSSPPELIVEEFAKEIKKSSIKNKKIVCKSPIPPELEPILPASKRIVMPGSGPPELMPIEIPKKVSSKKKIERKADKVFDPNKHCGVINDAGKPCLRSILCKVHLVAHKRAVLNRSMPYDALTKLLKSQNDEEKRPKVEVLHPVLPPLVKEPQPSICVLTIPTVSNEAWPEQTTLKQEPAAKRLKTEDEEDQYALPSDLDALIEATLKDVEENEPLPVIPVVPRPEPLLRWSLETPQLPPASCSPPPIIQPDEIPWHPSHPRPLATNTFGCRLVGGLLSKCKKLETFRKHVQSVWAAPGRGGLSDSSSKLTSFTAGKTSSLMAGRKSQLSTTIPRRKRKNSGSSTATVIPPTTTSDIISGLLRAGQTNSNGVPLRLFQGNLPGQQPTYIQFNLCPSK